MKDIPGYEGLYAATEDGRIWSHRSKIFLSSPIDAKGYQIVNLKRKTWKVHRLIAITYLQNPKNKYEINHKNGIKTDNRVENLEWQTRSGNIKHAWDNGLNSNQLKKIHEKKFKVSKDDIISHLDKGCKIKDLCKMFDTNRSTLWKIMKEYGIERDRKKIDKIDKNILVIYLNRGYTTEQIASKFNVSAVTIRRFERKNNLQRRVC